MSYYVRPMGKKDIRQVSEIDREAFSTQFPPPDYRRELQNPLARLIVVCDRDRTVAEPKGEAQGIPGLVSKIRQLWRSERFFGEKSSSGNQYIPGFAGIWVMADEAHLTNIAVRKQYQRQGIGELLLISITNLAVELKADFITLEVRVSNTTGQSLYQKYGFTQVGIRQGYYTDNREGALIMSTESITSASFQVRLEHLKRAYARKYGAANNPLVKIPTR